jgi:hypothetical protein
MIKKCHLLIAALGALLNGPIAHAQTSVTAGTLTSAHWTLSGSPYKIMGHIIVANGDSLVIDPGVVVEFQGNYKLFCNGKILANGTSAQPILFTVPVANRGIGWLGIRYDNTPTTNGRSIFQYCTLEYGRANAAGDNSGGAFYFNNYSNCTISHCTLRNNYAYWGGCIAGTQSSPTLLNCSFSNNTSSQGGECVELSYSASIIDSCAFTNSGITSVHANLTITNCTFTKCLRAGGISLFADHNSGSGYSLIAHNVFDSCTQVNGGGGGAILLFNEKARIEHNIFKNNIAQVCGGAISCHTQTSYPNSGSTIISNNLFYSNRAVVGGAIYFSNCSGKIINNTIVNNSSDTMGGAIFCGYQSSPSFYNNIIFDNTSDGRMENIFVLDNTSDPNFYNNDLQGGFAAINSNGTPLTGANVNNITTTPNFTSASTHVYTLATGSACIDAGDTIGVGSLIPAADLANYTRMTNANIDIGAYESFGPATEVKPMERVSLKVLPNPAGYYFQIYGLTASDLQSVQLIDLTGKQALYFENPASNYFTIDYLASGVYMVKVNFRNGNTAIGRLSKN